MTLSPTTLADQVVCIERELKRRVRMFPAKVKTHRMTQREADRELAAITAVLETLTALSRENR